MECDGESKGSIATTRCSATRSRSLSLSPIDHCDDLASRIDRGMLLGRHRFECRRGARLVPRRQRHLNHLHVGALGAGDHGHQLRGPFERLERSGAV